MNQWGNVVDILVENSGRINYKKLNNAYMGLKEQVGFSGNFDASWNVWSLPFDQRRARKKQARLILLVLRFI